MLIRKIFLLQVFFAPALVVFSFSLKRLLQVSQVNDGLRRQFHDISPFVWWMKGSRFEDGDETDY